MSRLSLFPEVDEEIKQIKASEAIKLQEIKNTSTRFIPSNGVEGVWLEDTLCVTCGHFNKRCSVLKELLFGSDGSCDLLTYQDNVICLQHSDFSVRDFLILHEKKQK